MRRLVPSDWVQATLAFPEGSTAIAGPEALTPGSEIVCAAAHAPFGVRLEDWILKFVPSERVHTAITVPSGATTTCGSKPSLPGSEMLMALSQVGVAEAAAGKIKAAPRTKMKTCQRIAPRNVDNIHSLPARDPCTDWRDRNTEPPSRIPFLGRGYTEEDYMSRRRVAALSALIVVPVLVLAIVLASVLGGDSSDRKAPATTEPAQTAPQPGGGTGRTPATPAAPAAPGTGTGGAKVPAGSLPVLSGGTPPKQLSDKLGPASSKGTIDLAQLRGAPVVLNIWSADCTPCRAESRVLESEWERLGPRGIVFLGLNVLDSPSAARRFRSDYDVTYPSVQQQRADTAKQLGARGVPETFFISKGGEIVAHVIGAVSLAQIELGVRAAQTGREMPTDQGGGQIPLR